MPRRKYTGKEGYIAKKNYGLEVLLNNLRCMYVVCLWVKPIKMLYLHLYNRIRKFWSKDSA